MNVITVTELNTLIKNCIEREYLLKGFYVTGTIVNATHHRNGHYYFTIKDEENAIDVTLWSTTAKAKNIGDLVENGLLVTIKGSVQFYKKMGRLQVIVSDMQSGAKSPLQLAFERMKADMTALGYFEDAHKQPIPELSSCIGIVTSSSGAVLHDILHISARRNPLVRFKLFSVPVQGDTAASYIAKGIQLADADPDVDLIIVGRGGGSMEDLWCFNERIVVEAVYHVKTPVISAVGHETDYTLIDYVADQRGATPSHAAEMAVLPLTVLIDRLAQIHSYVEQTMTAKVQEERQILQNMFHKAFGLPLFQVLQQQRQQLDKEQQQLQATMEHVLQQKQHDLQLVAQILEHSNPLHIMMKGYSKIETKGHNLTSVIQVAIGDTLDITVADGTVQATVKEVQHG